jgi:hypothetical protein
MRDYFLSLLQTLDKLTGIRQYEKLCSMKDFKTEINLLLDILCRVTDQYGFIPDEHKKQIISDAVISDQEFIGLNAKFIAKSLNIKREFYLKTNDEPVISPDALTGEARENRLKEWMTAINGLEMTKTVNKFDHIKSIQPADGQAYKPKQTNEYEYRRHLDYIQDNYDPKTGEALPTWQSEEEYNKVYDEVMKPGAE